MDSNERRQRRSNDPLVALHYQLAKTRCHADFHAVVVADSAGLVVAGAGSWALCEELAAYAPLLATCDESAKTSERVAELRRETAVCSVDVGGQSVFVCGWGRSSEQGALSGAARGVSRILSQAA